MPSTYFDEENAVTVHVFWNVLGPNYYYQKRLYKTGNALKDTGSTFYFSCDKTHTRCTHYFICAFIQCKLFLLNNVFYNCPLLSADSRCYSQKSGLHFTQQMICWHPYSHLIHWSIYCVSCYVLFHNYFSFLSFLKKLGMSIFFEDEQLTAIIFKKCKMITA